MAGTDFVAPVMDALLACLEDGLTKPVGRAHLAVGEVAFDDCCNGQAWVRLISQTPFFGDARATARRCGPDGWVLTLGFGAVRCAAVINDQGTSPSPGQLMTETHLVAQDAADVATAVMCCDLEALALKGLYLDRWDAITPDGACVGGEWLGSLTVRACPCPPPTPTP